MKSTAVFFVFLLLSGIVAASETVTSGIYYFGHEVESFHPCGSKHEYWVDGPKHVLTPLRALANRLRSRAEPYPPIYVRFVGHIGEKDKSGGFAEDYDAIYYVAEVRSVSEKVPEDCATANPALKRDASSARPLAPR